jgi:alpha-amylase
MALHDLGGDKDALRLCVALQMTSLGIPMIYYGEEVGRADSVWPMNRSDMPWGPRAVLPGKGIKRDEILRAYYKRLIAIRRENVALSSGGFQRLYSDGDLLVFARATSAGDAVVVAVNRGTAPGRADVDAPASWEGRIVTEALSGAPASMHAGKLAVDVPARTAHVYVRH